MKTIKLNGNPELSETSCLWAVAAVLEQDSQNSFDVIDGDILEYEGEETIYWKVEGYEYFEDGSISAVHIDC